MTLYAYLMAAVIFLDPTTPPKHHRLNTFNTPVECVEAKAEYKTIIENLQTADTVEEIHVYCYVMEQPYTKL